MANKKSSNDQVLDAAPAVSGQPVSITFQCPEASRDVLGRLSAVYGWKGNLSWMVDEAISFFLAHQSDYQEWREFHGFSDLSDLVKTTTKTGQDFASRLEQVAFEAGHRRRHPWDEGRVRGNLSWAVNEAVDFFLSHLGEYLDWRDTQFHGVVES